MKSRTTLKKTIQHRILTGDSINTISVDLGLAKSTIYYHYKKLKGKKYSDATIPKSNKIIGEFLGALAGDGNLFHNKKTSQYTIRFHFHRWDDAQYSKYIQSLVKNHFKKIPREHVVGEKAIVIKFYSKKIFEFASEQLNIYGKKGQKLKLSQDVNSYDKIFLQYFVRGLIDTDGSVTKNRTIVLGLISSGLIDQTSQILTTFNISHRKTIRKREPIWRDLHILTITSKNSQKYLKEIGFSNLRKKKRCAGRDSNSRS